MKKFLITAILLLGMKTVSALPLGNPSEASLFFCETLCDECCFDPCHRGIFSCDFIDLNVGYYGDFVFDRNLETDGGRKIDYSQISTNAGYLALRFWETFDIFTTFGATKFKFNTSFGPFNSVNPSPRFDFETCTTFSWSVGGHATLWKFNRFSLGAMGQYFSARPMAKVLFLRANVNDYPDESSRRTYSEWQVGAGISYRYSYYFVPYAAVKYSRAFWDFDDAVFNLTGTQAIIPNLRSRKHWGYAIGLTLAPFMYERMAVTVEGRFADEAALYINGQLYF